jgi:hypothetical protein
LNHWRPKEKRVQEQADSFKQVHCKQCACFITMTNLTGIVVFCSERCAYRWRKYLSPEEDKIAVNGLFIPKRQAGDLREGRGRPVKA